MRTTLIALVALAVIGCSTGGSTNAGDLRTRVEWLQPAGMVSAELYGSGAGVWNDERAFRMPPADVAEIARAVGRAGFARMPDLFGEEESDFLRMRGKVTVNDKTVVQVMEGDQSEELASLAAEILTRAESAARNGVTATSFDDALQKIVSGEIPPEALRVTIQQRSDVGFLLHIRGGDAVARPFAKKSGYGQQRRLRLTADELRSLAALLSELPPIAPAPVYTELRVEVLNQSKDLQARPEMAIAPNMNFDRIVGELRRLAERVIASGSVETG
jgi:hypothetical protein